MTQHRLKLHIAKHIPDDPGIVGTRTVTLRERIMRKLLGLKQIDIAETDDDLMALADAVGVTHKGGDAA